MDEPKKPKKPKSARADKPYAVGKGKPPVEHQFKHGQLPPKKSGRPKGSRNKPDLEKLLDEKVQVGTDRLGRPIRRTFRNVINRQLTNKAAKGDLAAIKFVKELELKLASLKLRNGPDPETVRRELEEQAEKEKLTKRVSAGVVAYLETVAELKRLGIITTHDDKIVIQEWVHREAVKWGSSDQDDEPA